MYEISDKFRAALRGSRTIVARAELYRQGRLIGEDIPINSGTITDDSTAVIRRRVQLELPATDEVLALLPSTPPEDGGLWPLGNEIKLFTGIDYEDGTSPEYIPAGVFRISRPKLQDNGVDVSVSLEGFDRGMTVSRAKFTTPYTVRSGQNYADEIKKLILSRMPWLDPDLSFKFMETDFTTPVLTFLDDDDPMETAVLMATSIGAELFPDFEGAFVLRPEPDLAVGVPVFDYIEGEEATITGIVRDLDESETYNGLVVSGETTSNEKPIQAVEWDTDPDSPTYYDPNNPAASVYGPHPDFETSEFVTNFTQAQAMARAGLRRRLGVIEAIDFSAIVNPAHESNDIIALKRDRIHVNNVYILESFQAGIGPEGTMSGKTRKRRVAA